MTGDICTYEQIAEHDLKDLRLQTRTAGEDLLENANQDMAQWCTDESSICCHLGHSGSEVAPTLCDVLRDPRGEEFLQRGQCTGSQHFCAEGVCLELLEVCLRGGHGHQQRCHRIYHITSHRPITYRQITLLSNTALSSSQCCTDLVRQFVLSRLQGG